MEGCPKAPLIKICGLKAPEEAALASSLGASFCGFIFHPPSPRSVTPEAAAAMRTPGALRVGVFVRQQAAEIEEIMEKAGLDLAQLHGEHGLETAKALGRERVVKVFWPERRRMGPDGKEERLSDLLEGWKDLAKMLLFDAGQSLGGHGRKLEASFSSPLPYLLAGGLSARDVLSAL